MDSTPGLRNTGSGGRAVAGLRMVWNAIIDPPVPGGSAQAAHRHCTRPFPGESGLATRDYAIRTWNIGSRKLIHSEPLLTRPAPSSELSAPDHHLEQHPSSGCT